MRIRDLINPGYGMEKIGSGIQCKEETGKNQTLPWWLGGRRGIKTIENKINWPH
jgi:hypothetical protein